MVLTEESTKKVLDRKIEIEEVYNAEELYHSSKFISRIFKSLGVLGSILLLFFMGFDYRIEMIANGDLLDKFLGAVSLFITIYLPFSIALFFEKVFQETNKTKFLQEAIDKLNSKNKEKLGE